MDQRTLEPPEYYRTYGDYFVKWIQAFEKEGIKIHAVTPAERTAEPR